MKSSEELMENVLVIDAAGAPLGRVASCAARFSLRGRKVRIVNCNNAIIIGNKTSILQKYKRARARGGSSLKGPNFPRQAERIMKRTIRGMLPYKKAKGREALKSIICYNSIPKDFKDSQKLCLRKELKANSITLAELSKNL